MKQITNYTYKIFGLCVQSEIEITEAIPSAFEKAEVLVTCDPVPKVYGDIPKKDRYPRVDAIWFDVAQEDGTVIEYWIIQGKTIYINAPKSSSLERIKAFLLGTAFGFLLIERQSIAIHGGCVASNDKAIILTGESGAGKSTIATALQKSGFSFVADDVSVISLETSKAYVQPAYPQQKLCRDAAIGLGYDLSDLLYLGEDRDKFAVRLKDGYVTEKQPLFALIELCVSKEDIMVPELTEITGVSKLALLLSNLYRNMIFHYIKQEPFYMQQCLELANQVSVYRIIRPATTDSTSKIQEMIKELM